MSLFHRRSLTAELHRDRLVDLLAESEFVRDRLREDEQKKITERQRLVDLISAARQRADAQLPRLEKAARDAHAKLAPIMAKLQTAEREYLACVRELADLDFQTGLQIDQAERALRETADPAIREFVSVCIDHHDRLRRTPRQHVHVRVLPPVASMHPDAKITPADPASDILALALAETNRIRREAEALTLQACLDVGAELDRLRSQLPVIDGSDQ